MWSAIPMLVTESAVGTALGLTTCFQMIGVGVCNLIVGSILGPEGLPVEEMLLRWKYVMIFLLANLVACAVVAVILNIVEKRNVSFFPETRFTSLSDKNSISPYLSC